MILKKQNPETDTGMQPQKLSIIALAKRHPLLTSLFAFWGFGYTFMVPNLLGGRFLFAFFRIVGKSPGDAFMGFSLLFAMVFLFAGIVPFLIWYLVCRALESGESSPPLS